MISKLSIMILLIFLIACTINAQQKDSIIVDYSFWGNDYFIGGKEYSRGEVRDILRNNSLTEELIRSSKSNKIWGYVSLSAGMILSVETALNISAQVSSGYTNTSWALPAMIAIGLDITGIVLLTNSKNKFYQAINLYNSNLPSKNQAYGYELDLKCDLNRITLTLKF